MCGTSKKISFVHWNLTECVNTPRTCPNPAGVGQYKRNSMVFLWAFCFICCCFGISVLLLERKKVGRSWEGGNMKSMV